MAPHGDVSTCWPGLIEKYRRWDKYKGGRNPWVEVVFLTDVLDSPQDVFYNWTAMYFLCYLSILIYMPLILLFIYCSNLLRPLSKPSPAHAGHDSSKCCECKCCHKEFQQTKEISTTVSTLQKGYWDMEKWSALVKACWNHCSDETQSADYTFLGVSWIFC